MTTKEELKTLKDLEIKPELDEGTQFTPYVYTELLKSEALEGKRNYEAEQYVVSFFDRQFERDNSKFTKLRDLFNKTLSDLLPPIQTSVLLKGGQEYE